MGMEKRPRFHGPGLKRLPTKKTRMTWEHRVNIHICFMREINPLDWTYDGSGEGDESGCGANTEKGTDCELAAEDEEQHQTPDDIVEPDCVDRGTCAGVDVLPDVREWETSITGIGKLFSKSANPNMDWQTLPKVECDIRSLEKQQSCIPVPWRIRR